MPVKKLHVARHEPLFQGTQRLWHAVRADWSIGRLEQVVVVDVPRAANWFLPLPHCTEPDLSSQPLAASVTHLATAEQLILTMFVGGTEKRVSPLSRLQVYGLFKRQGIWPHPAQFNRLIAEFAAERQLTQVVILLDDMINKAGLAPDRFTFAALLDVCCKV